MHGNWDDTVISGAEGASILRSAGKLLLAVLAVCATVALILMVRS